MEKWQACYDLVQNAAPALAFSFAGGMLLRDVALTFIRQLWRPAAQKTPSPLDDQIVDIVEKILDEKAKK